MFSSGADGLVNCDLIPILIKKIPTEEDEIKVSKPIITNFSQYFNKL